MSLAYIEMNIIIKPLINKTSSLQGRRSNTRAGSKEKDCLPGLAMFLRYPSTSERREIDDWLQA